MQADRTAVTIQSNKIVSNEVKDNSTTRAQRMEKTKQTFWPTQYFTQEQSQMHKFIFLP